MMRYLLVIAAFAIGLAGMAMQARSHDFYVGKKDPVTRASCCTTSANEAYGDCRTLIITKANFFAEELGYRVILTHAEALKINLQSQGAVNVLVPYERVQPSGDGNYHICLGPAGRLHCFFEPGNG